MTTWLALIAIAVEAADTVPPTVLPTNIGPSEMWTAINSIALAIIGAFAYFNNKRATKGRRNSEQRLHEVNTSIQQVGKEITKVQDNVNGPLLQAHQMNCHLSMRIAELTKDPKDIKAAQDAAAMCRQAELQQKMQAATPQELKARETTGEGDKDSQTLTS